MCGACGEGGRGGDDDGGAVVVVAVPPFFSPCTMRARPPPFQETHKHNTFPCPFVSDFIHRVPPNHVGSVLYVGHIASSSSAAAAGQPAVLVHECVCDVRMCVFVLMQRRARVRVRVSNSCCQVITPKSATTAPHFLLVPPSGGGARVYRNLGTGSWGHWVSIQITGFRSRGFSRRGQRRERERNHSFVQQERGLLVELLFPFSLVVVPAPRPKSRRMP